MNSPTLLIQACSCLFHNVINNIHKIIGIHLMLPLFIVQKNHVYLLSFLQSQKLILWVIINVVKGRNMTVIILVSFSTPFYNWIDFCPSNQRRKLSSISYLRPKSQPEGFKVNFKRELSTNYVEGLEICIWSWRLDLIT
jgi:hypothetical protein